MENLLVKRDGCMFHVDFGFILGKHPPMKGNFIPPIRINEDIINGMGGMESDGYKDFKEKATKAFLVLRQHRHFLLDVVMAMVDSSIPNIPRNECIQILDELNARFLSKLSDTEATQRFEGIINESVNATWVEVLEQAHKVSVYFK